MTPIEVLFSLKLTDEVIAERLRVARWTVSRWRTKKAKPYERYQTIALAYLSEIQQTIILTLTQAAFSKAS